MTFTKNAHEVPKFQHNVTSLFNDFDLSVCEDKNNSYHFPIIIEQINFSSEDHNLKSQLPIFYLILPPHLLKSLKNVFLKLLQIQLKVIRGTMSTVRKRLNNADKLSISIQKISILTV